MKVFVDSGPLIALLDARDQHHARAVAALRKLEAASLVTSAYVVSEAAERARRLVGPAPVAAFVRRLLEGKLYRVVDFGLGVMGEALDAMVRYDEHRLSFVDCTNLVLMKAGRIPVLFTFDGAFRRLGIRVLP